MKKILVINETEHKNINKSEFTLNIALLSILDTYTDIKQIIKLFSDFNFEFNGGRFAIVYGNGDIDEKEDISIIKFPLGENTLFLINHDCENASKLINMIKNDNLCAGIYELETNFFTPVANAKKAYFNHIVSGNNKIFLYKPINPYLCEIEAERIIKQIEKFEFDNALLSLKKFESIVSHSDFTVEECFYVLNKILQFVFFKFQSFNYFPEQWSLLYTVSCEYSIDNIFYKVSKIIYNTKTNVLYGHSYRYKKITNDIIEYIKNNYNKQILLKDIAEQFNINSNYLGTLFKNTFGLTYTEYLKQYRMTRACELLESTEYTVEEIGEQVGYTDYYSFIKAFKHHVGISPTAYKKNHKV